MFFLKGVFLLDCNCIVDLLPLSKFFDPDGFSLPFPIFFGVLYSSMNVFVSFNLSFFPGCFFLLLLRLECFLDVDNFFFDDYSWWNFSFFLLAEVRFFKVNFFFFGEQLLENISELTLSCEDFFFSLLFTRVKNFFFSLEKWSIFSNFYPPSLAFSVHIRAEVAKSEGLVYFFVSFFFRSSDKPEKSNSFMMTPSSFPL